MSTRGLTFRYLLALGLIALLSIVSHFMLAETLRANEGSAEIINLSGRQRMLSQRIVALALEVGQGDESARTPLGVAIDQFSRAHDRLLGLIEGGGDE